MVLFLLMLPGMNSCKKDPGPGGSSSISGKVFVHDYNSTFTVLEDAYYGQEVDVYLIYGDDKTYSDHVKTNYDGAFEFKYLQKGMYHLYVYSADSTLQTNAFLPVIRDVEITKNKQEVVAEQLTIVK